MMKCMSPAAIFGYDVLCFAQCFLSMKWANGSKAVWDGLRRMTMKSGYEFYYKQEAVVDADNGA